MSIFAEVGSSFQQVGGDCPEGWIVMDRERPSHEHTAHADGTWSIDTVKVDREKFKESREIAVSKIKVTSSLGRVFDGAEVDTTRMLKPITVLKEKPAGTAVTWVLADNTVVDVALDEFLEVVEKAGLEQTRLWIQPNDEA